MSSGPVTLTTFERVFLLAKLSTLIVDYAWAICTAPFRGTSGALTPDRHIQNAIVRALARKLTVRELQFVRGTTTQAFNKWRDTHSGEPLSTEVLTDGAKLHWIGDRSTEKVILLIHGGGYVLPLSDGHLKMMTAFRDGLRHHNVLVSIACLEYTTSPHAPYPTQFRQAVIAVSHLLKDGRPPSSLIIFGDSAGAHIALCLVSHVLHPYPGIAPLNLPGPLGGLCFVSPRTTNATDATSCAENSNKDILDKGTYRRWIDSFTSGSSLSSASGQTTDGPYTNPVGAPSTWWEDLADRVSDRVFISAGQHECMRDYQVAFAEQWKKVAGLDLTLVVEPRGIHDSPLMDIGAGRLKSDLIQAIESWLAQSFEGDALSG